MRRADYGHAGDGWRLQDVDKNYESGLRPVRRAFRGNGFDVFGRPIIEPRTAGEVVGSIVWRNSTGTATGAGAGSAKPPREVPAWSWAFPVKAIDKSSPDGEVHTVKVLPVGDRELREDKRFETITARAPATVAKGQFGILLAATEEHDQVEVFLPVVDALKAPHFGGTGEEGSLVYDVDDKGELDKDRKAPLQTITRVHEVPETSPGNKKTGLYGTPGEHALALQIGIAKWTKDAPNIRGALLADLPGSGGSTGLAFNTQTTGFAGKQNLGSLSWHLDGPCRLGCTKHAHGGNKDGDSYGAVHISTRAFFIQNGDRDAPLEFSGAYPKASPPGGKIVQVYLSYDDNESHPTVLGARRGLWRWWTAVPVYPTDPDFPDEEFPGQPKKPPPKIPQRPRIPGKPDDPRRPRIPEDPPPLIGLVPGQPRLPGGGFGGSVEDGDGNTLVSFPGGKGGRPDPTRPPSGSDGLGLGKKLDKIAGGGGGGGGGGLDDLDKLVRTSPDARKDRLNLSILATLQEFAAPGFVLRAQNLDKGARDYRNDRNWTSQDFDAVNRAWPVVARIEPIARQQGASFLYTGLPGSTRYRGGTANSVVAFLPPELGAEQIQDGLEPSTVSSTFWTFYRSQLGFGKPSGGKIVNGYQFNLSSSTYLGLDRVNSSGAVAEEAFSLDGTNSVANVFGQPVASPCFYGDGSDGTFTADGAATPLDGVSRSGSVYTQQRDYYPANLTIQNGVEWQTNGYRLHVKTKLVVDSGGKITNNGNAGADGTALGGGAGGAATNTGSLGQGMAGGNGGFGSAGTNGTAVTNSGGGSGQPGGNGGGGALGGSGGSRSLPAASTGGFRAMPQAALGACLGSSGVTTVNGGSGGGGGGSAAATAGGGGGGGSGGPLMIAARWLELNGTLECKGGAGGTAYDDGATAAGGGGGGGGGIAWLAWAKRTGSGSVANTSVATGGTAGTGKQGGGNGVAGTVGKVVTLCG